MFFTYCHTAEEWTLKIVLQRIRLYSSSNHSKISATLRRIVLGIFGYRFSGYIKSNYTYHLIRSHDVVRISHIWEDQGVDQFGISFQTVKRTKSAKSWTIAKKLRGNSGSGFALVSIWNGSPRVTRANLLPLFSRNIL